MEKFIKCLPIESAEVDCLRNLRPSSFLCATQEVANQHATSLGFGYDQLIGRHCAWVLSRIKAEFIHSPKWQQETNIITWHKGLNGVFSLRDFEVRSLSGEILIRCTSSWVIINLDNRKLQRIDHLLSEDFLSSAVQEDTMPEPCDKLISPENFSFSSSHRVLFSDIDFNHHTNNAKYLEWAFDSIDSELITTREIDSFQLNINHETKLGDIIRLQTATLSPCEFFVEGTIDNTNIFQSTIKLKP